MIQNIDFLKIIGEAIRPVIQEELQNYFSKAEIRQTETDNLWFEEAKELLQVTSGTLYQWRAKGIIPSDCYWKSGKRLMFSKAKLLEWQKTRNHEKS